MADKKILDTLYQVPKKRGNGLVRGEAWADSRGEVTHYNLAYINHGLSHKDNAVGWRSSSIRSTIYQKKVSSCSVILPTCSSYYVPTIGHCSVPLKIALVLSVTLLSAYSVSQTWCGGISMNWNAFGIVTLEKRLIPDQGYVEEVHLTAKRFKLEAELD